MFWQMHQITDYHRSSFVFNSGRLTNFPLNLLANAAAQKKNHHFSFPNEMFLFFNSPLWVDLAIYGMSLALKCLFNISPLSCIQDVIHISCEIEFTSEFQVHLECISMK